VSVVRRILDERDEPIELLSASPKDGAEHAAVAKSVMFGLPAIIFFKEREDSTWLRKTPASRRAPGRVRPERIAVVLLDALREF